jgi:hypothetical protein
MVALTMQDGREKLARELADTEALRASESLRARLTTEGLGGREVAMACDEEFRRVYESTFAEAMLGGS